MTTNPGRGSPSGPVKVRKISFTLDHGVCAAHGVDIAPTVAVANLRVTDVVVLNPPAAGMAVNLALGRPYCSSAGVLTVPVINPTAGGIASGSLTYNGVVLRYDS